jgi:hypothetical protein
MIITGRAAKIELGTRQADGTIAWSDLTLHIRPLSYSWSDRYVGPASSAPGYVSPRRAARRAHRRRMKRRGSY